MTKQKVAALKTLIDNDDVAGIGIFFNPSSTFESEKEKNEFILGPYGICLYLYCSLNTKNDAVAEIRRMIPNERLDNFMDNVYILSQNPSIIEHLFKNRDITFDVDTLCSLLPSNKDQLIKEELVELSKSTNNQIHYEPAVFSQLLENKQIRPRAELYTAILMQDKSFSESEVLNFKREIFSIICDHCETESAKRKLKRYCVDDLRDITLDVGRSGIPVSFGEDGKFFNFVHDILEKDNESQQESKKAKFTATKLSGGTSKEARILK